MVMGLMVGLLWRLWTTCYDGFSALPVWPEIQVSDEVGFGVNHGVGDVLGVGFENGIEVGILVGILVGIGEGAWEGMEVWVVGLWFWR